MNRKYILILIVLDLIWAIAALIYDYPVISQTPAYYWPFLVICPLFPFLLALVWSQIYKGSKPNSFLLAFAVIPSSIYFIGALIYYPTWMILNNFDWLSLGQIFWVAVYGIQAMYLLLKFVYTKIAVWLATAYLIISLIIQYETKTYGFQDFTNFSDRIFFAEYLTLSIIVLLLSIALVRYQKVFKHF